MISTDPLLSNLLTAKSVVMSRIAVEASAFACVVIVSYSLVDRAGSRSGRTCDVGMLPARLRVVNFI